MKKYLKDTLQRLNAKKANLLKRSDVSEDINEVKTIATEIDEVNAEIKEAEVKLAEVEAEEVKATEEKPAEEGRSATFDPAQALTVVATAKVGEARTEEVEDTRATMEYRKAFMNYVQRGTTSNVLQFEKRLNQTGTSSDLGVLIPSTVIQTIIQGVEKVYGSLYSKVKKTNLQGGVKYPLGAFSATFNRIGENEVSDRQDAGGVTGSVDFTYKIGEIRLARTLLQSVLSVPVFEQEFSKLLVKCYVEAMDKEIINGVDDDNQMVGILSAAGLARIPAGNIISFTAAEMADWTKWETKFFAEIPISLEKAGAEFVMAKQTYVSNLCTLKDNNNQPINKAGFDSNEKTHKFNEYPVNRTEKDIFKDFNSCDNDEYFGMFWVPEEAYAINSNLEFTIIHYFDQDTNQYVDKALIINDGKILDPKYIYLFKKSVQA